jgi:hypothetical protein
MNSPKSFTVTSDRISPETVTMTETELRAYLADMNQMNDWGINLDAIAVRDDGIYLDGEQIAIQA